MAAFEVGGQEVVTVVLSDLMVKYNHKVVVACYKKPNPQMLGRLGSNITFVELGGFNTSKKVINNLRETLSKFSIDIVINQWGLPYQTAFTLKKACKDIKVISVYHNQVDYNGKIANVENKIKKTSNKLLKSIYFFEKIVVRKITALSMRYVYNNSDAYILLSSSYVPLFSDFTGLKKTSKLYVITNPLTIPINEKQDINLRQKKDRILYVGRLDFYQKRVDRILDVWNLVYDKLNEWELVIVGDGPNRQELEQRSKELKLKNISFEGFKNPVPYYESAKLILLTSDFEGFPLVLLESMSYGIVPIVYDSYAAATDVIKNGENGVIIPKLKGAFCKDEAAKLLLLVATDSKYYEQLANNAIQTSLSYIPDNIYEKWSELFNIIFKNK